LAACQYTMNPFIHLIPRVLVFDPYLLFPRFSIEGSRVDCPECLRAATKKSSGFSHALTRNGAPRLPFSPLGLPASYLTRYCIEGGECVLTLDSSKRRARRYEECRLYDIKRPLGPVCPRDEAHLFNALVRIRSTPLCPAIRDG
jgi:hypothetical protein